MSFKADLFSHLSGLSALTDIVEQRIFPDFAPTTAELPLVTFQLITSRAVHGLAAGNSATPLMMEQFQIDAWGDRAIECDAIKEALHTAMDGFTGLFGTADVRRVFLENAIDATEPPSDGQNDARYRITMSFSIWYNRT